MASAVTHVRRPPEGACDIRARFTACHVHYGIGAAFARQASELQSVYRDIGIRTCRMSSGTRIVNAGLRLAHRMEGCAFRNRKRLRAGFPHRKCAYGVTGTLRAKGNSFRSQQEITKPRGAQRFFVSLGRP